MGWFFISVLIGGLNESTSPHISRTLHSNLNDLENTVISMVSILPLTSHSSSHFSWPLGTVPRTPSTFGITVTLIWHRFSSPLERSKHCLFFSFLSLSHWGLLESPNPLDDKVFFLLINRRCLWCNCYRQRGMDTATRVQILDETDCISHSTNTIGKGMNLIILPPAMGK